MRGCLQGVLHMARTKPVAKPRPEKEEAAATTDASPRAGGGAPDAGSHKGTRVTHTNGGGGGGGGGGEDSFGNQSTNGSRAHHGGWSRSLCLSSVFLIVGFASGVLLVLWQLHGLAMDQTLDALMAGRFPQLPAEPLQAAAEQRVKAARREATAAMERAQEARAEATSAMHRAKTAEADKGAAAEKLKAVEAKAQADASAAAQRVKAAEASSKVGQEEVALLKKQLQEAQKEFQTGLVELRSCKADRERNTAKVDAAVQKSSLADKEVVLLKEQLQDAQTKLQTGLAELRSCKADRERNAAKEDTAMQSSSLADKERPILSSELAPLSASTTWPSCIQKGVLLPAGGAQVFVDLVDLFGDAVSGCFREDCARTDQFQTSRLEECANLCAAVPSCAFWSLDTKALRCYLKGSDGARTASQGAHSAARGCAPPPTKVSPAQVARAIAESPVLEACDDGGCKSDLLPAVWTWNYAIANLRKAVIGIAEADNMQAFIQQIAEENEQILGVGPTVPGFEEAYSINSGNARQVFRAVRGVLIQGARVLPSRLDASVPRVARGLLCKTAAECAL